MSEKPALLNPPADAISEIKLAARKIDEIAQKHAATAAAVMIAWLLRHPAEIVPVIGASKPEHIKDNCTADRVILTGEEWASLYQAAAAVQPRSPNL